MYHGTASKTFEMISTEPSNDDFLNEPHVQSIHSILGVPENHNNSTQTPSSSNP